MSLYLGNEQIPSLGVSVSGVSSVNGETGDVTGLATEEYVDSAISSISTPDISGLATEEYVNNAISAIPTPDVSGQINTHNTSTGAHNDIRQLINDKASQSSLNSHTDNTTAHITAAERTAWNSKSNFSGNYNDLTNKPTIPAAYTHPTTSGNKHIPSGGSSGQILRWSADGTAVWGNDNNTTYSAGTGLTLDGTTFKHTNSITAGTVGTAQSPTHGGTFAIPSIT